MREWLSGGASPCQGEGRGFDPRLALEKEKRYFCIVSLFFESNPGLEVRLSTFHFGPRNAEVHRTSCAVSRSQVKQKDIIQMSFFSSSTFENIFRLCSEFLFSLKQ